jgi:nucleotide-binding universal stress UspA family protein
MPGRAGDDTRGMAVLAHASKDPVRDRFPRAGRLLAGARPLTRRAWWRGTVRPLSEPRPNRNRTGWAAKRRLAARVPGVRSLVRVGSLAEEVLRMAHDLRPAVVVMGTRGRTGFGEPFDPARAVRRKAACPVLFVHLPARMGRAAVGWHRGVVTGGARDDGKRIRSRPRSTGWPRARPQSCGGSCRACGLSCTAEVRPARDGAVLLREATRPARGHERDRPADRAQRDPGVVRRGGTRRSDRP